MPGGLHGVQRLRIFWQHSKHVDQYCASDIGVATAPNLQLVGGRLRSSAVLPQFCRIQSRRHVSPQGLASQTSIRLA